MMTLSRTICSIAIAGAAILITSTSAKSAVVTIGDAEINPGETGSINLSIFEPGQFIVNSDITVTVTGSRIQFTTTDLTTSQSNYVFHSSNIAPTSGTDGLTLTLSNANRTIRATDGIDATGEADGDAASIDPQKLLVSLEFFDTGIGHGNFTVSVTAKGADLSDATTTDTGQITVTPERSHALAIVATGMLGFYVQQRRRRTEWQR